MTVYYSFNLIMASIYLINQYNKIGLPYYKTLNTPVKNSNFPIMFDQIFL